MSSITAAREESRLCTGPRNRKYNPHWTGSRRNTVSTPPHPLYLGSYGEVANKYVVNKDCGFVGVPDERFRFLERLGLRRTALSALFKKMEAPIAAIGLELGALTELENATIILVAVLSGLLFPTAYKRLATKPLGGQ